MKVKKIGTVIWVQGIPGESLKVALTVTVCNIEKDLGILKRKKRNVSEMDYTNIIENVPNSEEEEEKLDCYDRTFPGYFVSNNDYI